MHERYPADPAGNGYDVPYRALRADPWNRWCDPRASERFFHDMDPWGGHCTDHGIYGNAVQDRNAEIYSPADHGRLAEPGNKRNPYRYSGYPCIQPGETRGGAF